MDEKSRKSEKSKDRLLSIDTNTHTLTRTHMYMHTHTHVYTPNIYIYMCVCVCVCVCYQFYHEVATYQQRGIVSKKVYFRLVLRHINFYWLLNTKSILI